MFAHVRCPADSIVFSEIGSFRNVQTFLGLDLAWRGNRHTSALAVMRGDAERLELIQVLESLRSDDDVALAIVQQSTPDTVLAIDAPLVITNMLGQRLCETAIGRRFGHADASAHTTNLRAFPDARSVRLTKRLMDAGWAHNVNPMTDKKRHGRWFFEVYPHPAHVVLFDLPKIIKYKKGPVAQRRAGLTKLRVSIAERLGNAVPSLLSNEQLAELTRRPLESIRGSALKTFEDGLDAVLCAFVAAHYWTWAIDRNEMIGTMTHGYIVTPNRTISGTAWQFARSVTAD